MSMARTACTLALALGLVLPTPGLACNTSPDAPLKQQCSGNGVCVGADNTDHTDHTGNTDHAHHVTGSAGTCACDPGWTGDSCSLLDFLPAQANTTCGPACACHGDGSTNASWGGQVVQNPTDGLYYMAVSEFSGGCGLSTWRCNSQIALARSTTPHRPVREAWCGRGELGTQRCHCGHTTLPLWRSPTAGWWRSPRWAMGTAVRPAAWACRPPTARAAATSRAPNRLTTSTRSVQRSVQPPVAPKPPACTMLTEAMPPPPRTRPCSACTTPRPRPPQQWPLFGGVM